MLSSLPSLLALAMAVGSRDRANVTLGAPCMCEHVGCIHVVGVLGGEGSQHRCTGNHL
jgi:hypothetical protein